MNHHPVTGPRLLLSGALVLRFLRGPSPRSTEPLHSAARLSAVILSGILAGCHPPPSSTLDLQWGDVTDRPWPGPDLWANRLQDWEVRDGKLSAVNSLPMRTVHILTRRSAPEDGGIVVTLRMGFSAMGESGLEGENGEGEGAGETADGGGEMVAGGGMAAEGGMASAGEMLSAVGILIGAGGAGLDYRRTALIHHSPGPGGGLFLGVDAEGYLRAADFSDGNRTLSRSDAALPATGLVELRIQITEEDQNRSGAQDDRGFSVAMEARAPEGPTQRGRGDPVTLEVSDVPGRYLTGGLALASHGTEEGGPTAWFSSVKVEGDGVVAHPDRALGPILGTQYTVSRDVLTLTTQLLPISPLEPGAGTASEDTVLLELQDKAGSWIHTATAPVVTPGYTATFRLDPWSGSSPVPFRVTLQEGESQDRERPYVGTLRADPQENEEFVVAAFTGNHNVASPGVDRGEFDWERNLWFPHEDMVKHIQSHGPDFLFFSGDQVYEGASPTRADYQNPYGDYLYKWYLWLWAFRDLTRELPTVTIPDDHDVFHGNVWGAGGRTTPPGLTGAEAQDQGGYRLPPDWVNMVQRTQTSHLPPPWDPTPSEDGLAVYCTDILFGGVSFAVLEDRKFKSPPKILLPEADIWNGWSQNVDFDARTQGDPPGASLLGRGQEEFLQEWAADWADGTWMKVVLSQTIFGNVATIPDDAMSGSVIPSLPIPEPGAYVDGDKAAADMDSNGWPASGRDRALRAMRSGFAVHLAGDQHLASTIQYGVEDYGDGPFALCVPSVANFWPRRWYPPAVGGNRAPGAPAYTGDFQDGFGNPMTVFAVSNPARWGREPSNLHDRAPGYGIARFNRTTRAVSLEAWPRWADPGAGDTPYPGWPVIFQQEEGYGKDPTGYLPTLEVEGLLDPVIQVISELGGEVLYTIRIRGNRFTPKVFGPGSYSVRVGEPGTGAMKTFLGLEATRDSTRVLEVGFSGSLEAP